MELNLHIYMNWSLIPESTEIIYYLPEQTVSNTGHLHKRVGQHLSHT